MPTVSLRVSESERVLWVEAAGGPQRMSAWLRAVANAALGERGEGSTRDSSEIPSRGNHREVPSETLPRSVSAVPYRRDFKPDPKAGRK